MPWSRAKVILWSAEGASNTEIADRLQWTKATVGKWRRRFLGRRVQGLCELRPGRPQHVNIVVLSALAHPVFFREIAVRLDIRYPPQHGGCSVFERVAGSYHIDYQVKRAEAARYNLSVAQVNQIIEAAVG